MDEKTNGGTVDSGVCCGHVGGLQNKLTEAFPGSELHAVDPRTPSPGKGALCDGALPLQLVFHFRNRGLDVLRELGGTGLNGGPKFTSECDHI